MSDGLRLSLRVTRRAHVAPFFHLMGAQALMARATHLPYYQAQLVPFSSVAGTSLGYEWRTAS